MTTLQSLLTPITRNIPAILREPAEALIGEKCYASLVYNVDIADVGCLKYALSKGLGLGIVVGGGIVKIPQILKIVNTHSARGLSLPAYILETVSYAVSLAYNIRNQFPFSTYGETFFLTLQNIAITLLILFYSTPRGALTGGLGASKPVYGQNHSNLTKVITGLVVTFATGIFLASPSLCPIPLLSTLQAATLPISLLSKAPQIISNHRAKSTGNLSAFAVFNALLGCLARLFTTKQEVNDPLIFWGFAGAAVLNAVLALQMVVYWSDSDGARRKGADEPILSGPGGYAEKGARKLD